MNTFNNGWFKRVAVAVIIAGGPVMFGLGGLPAASAQSGSTSIARHYEQAHGHGGGHNGGNGGHSGNHGGPGNPGSHGGHGAQGGHDKNDLVVVQGGR